MYGIIKERRNMFLQGGWRQTGEYGYIRILRNTPFYRQSFEREAV